MSGYKRPSNVLEDIEALKKELPRARRTNSYESDQPPDAPLTSPVITFYVREKFTHLHYRAVVTFGLTTPNTCEADIEAYWVEMRPLLLNDSGGSINGGDGHSYDPVGQIVNLHVLASASPLQMHMKHVENPKKWYWRARYKVADKAHRESPFGPWSLPTLPFDDALPKPPIPQNSSLYFTIKEYGIHPRLWG